jgi:hypothetical protein
MTPKKIIYRKLIRNGGKYLLQFDEITERGNASHEVQLDDVTKEAFQAAFSCHPFPKKNSNNDSVTCKSLSTVKNSGLFEHDFYIYNGKSRFMFSKPISKTFYDYIHGIFKRWQSKSVRE